MDHTVEIVKDEGVLVFLMWTLYTVGLGWLPSTPNTHSMISLFNQLSNVQMTTNKMRVLALHYCCHQKRLNELNKSSQSKRRGNLAFVYRSHELLNDCNGPRCNVCCLASYPECLLSSM